MTEVIASRDNERVKRAPASCGIQRRAAEGRSLPRAAPVHGPCPVCRREVYCTQSCWMRTWSLPPCGRYW